MGGTRQADDAVAWYCHYRLSKLLDEGKKQKELALIGEIPPSAVNHLLKHGRGTGPTTAAGFAKIFGFKTRGQLTDAADLWWATHEARRYAKQAKHEMDRERRIKDLDESEPSEAKKSRPKTA